MSHATLKLLHHGSHIVEVALHRPTVLNAMSSTMFSELLSAFQHLHASPSVRCILLTGGTESKAFTSGLDLVDHAALLGGGGQAGPLDGARRSASLQRTVQHYQSALSAVASVRAPVIAALHGACIGGGVDLACAADIRLATADASLRVAEARLGLCADLGTLQRLPRLVGSDSWAREVCLTARSIPAAEALARGLLSGPLYPSQAALREGALAMAAAIAALSPVAVLGTKSNLNFARDHGVGSALAYQAAWSAASLLTEDIGLSMAAKKDKAAEFKDVP
jgi:enoyl-CoA hydratase/carnithine racemase